MLLIHFGFKDDIYLLNVHKEHELWSGNVTSTTSVGRDLKGRKVGRRGDVVEQRDLERQHLNHQQHIL